MDLQANDNVCRICLKRQDTLFSLFRNVHGASPYQKLVSKTNLKIELNDAGPSSICSQCLIDLDTTVSFLERCEQSNRALAEFIQRREEALISNFKVACPEKLEEEESWIELEPVARLRPPTIEDEHLSTLTKGKESAKVSSLALASPKCEKCGSRRRCVHWAPPTNFTCHYCGKMFNKKYNFLIHIKRHLGEREWPCPVCGSLQVTGSLARRHCRPKVLRRCPVPACGKTFTNNSNLRIHIRSHSGEKPFECHDCGKGFSSKKTLRDHVRIHTGEKPYMCSICGARFTSNHISSHMRTHGECSPRLACSHAHCSRAFHSAGALRSHARSHLALRTFACALCARQYKFKQSLNKHVKKTHGVTHGASQR